MVWTWVHERTKPFDFLICNEMFVRDNFFKHKIHGLMFMKLFDSLICDEKFGQENFLKHKI